MVEGDSGAAPDEGNALRKRIVPILMMLTLMGNMSLQVILPAMPSIQQSFHAGTAGVQLLVSLSFFVFGFAMLIYGPLADVYGRRPVYLTGMVIFATGNLLCAFAPSLPVLIFGRTVSSAGSSVSMVLPRAIIRDLFASHQTASLIARISMVAAFAPMVAPTVGGVVSDLFGWRVLFGILSVVGLSATILIAYLLPETLREAGSRFSLARTLGAFGGLLKDRRYAGYAFCGAFIASVFFVFMTSAPFVYIGLLHLTATRYAGYYTSTIAGILVGYGIASRLAGRVSLDRTLVRGSLACVIATLLGVVGVLVLPWTPLTLTLPVIGLALGYGVVMPSSQAAVVSGDARVVGAASGLAGFLQMLVGGLLIQGVGAMPHTTPYPMVVTMAVTALCGAGAVVWGVRAPAGARSDQAGSP